VKEKVKEKAGDAVHDKWEIETKDAGRQSTKQGRRHSGRQGSKVTKPCAHIGKEGEIRAPPLLLQIEIEQFSAVGNKWTTWKTSAKQNPSSFSPKLEN